MMCNKKQNAVLNIDLETFNAVPDIGLCGHIAHNPRTFLIKEPPVFFAVFCHILKRKRNRFPAQRQVLLYSRNALHRSFAFNNHLDSLEKNAEVQQQGPVLNIFPVQLYHLVKVPDLTASAYLPQSRDSGFR